MHNKVDSLKLAILADSAELLSLSGYLNQGIRIYQAIGHIADSIQSNYWKIKSLIGLSASEAGNSHYEKAFQLLQQAERLCETDSSNYHLLSVVCNNLGSLLYLWGNYEKALEYYQKAITIRTLHISNVTLENIYVNIGAVLNEMNQPKQAIYYLKKGEEQALSNKNFVTLTTILNNIGIAYAKSNQLDSSEVYFKACLSYGEVKGQHKALQMAYKNLGKMALQKKDPLTAIDYFNKVMSSQNNSNDQSQVLVAMAMAYLELNKLPKAKTYLHDALEIARRDNLLHEQLNIHETFFKLYQKENNHKAALQNHIIVKKLSDSIYNKQKALAVIGMETQYRTAEKDKEILKQKLHLNHQQTQIKQQNTWILLSSGGAVVLFALIGILYYRHKNTLIQQHYQQERIQWLEKENELSRLLSIMKGEEQERLRIARELHDGIGSMLATARLNLATISREITEVTKNETFKNVSILLDHTSEEVRNTSHKLMPEILVKHTLKDAIMQYCETINTSKELNVDFQFYGMISDISKEIQLFLYRIIQELLQNVIKHAQASAATVQVMRYEGELSITVEDNGIGFDPKKTNHTGIGIKNILSRVASLQGHFSIETPQSKGAIVMITFDYDYLFKLSGQA